MSFPTEVERIAVVCGASRCGDINRVFLASIEAALKADSVWDEDAGYFSGRPTRGLLAFSSIYAGWGVGASYYTERAYLAAGYSSAEDFVARSYVPAFATCDGDDLLSQIQTWRSASAGGQKRRGGWVGWDWTGWGGMGWLAAEEAGGKRGVRGAGLGWGGVRWGGA